LVSVIAAHVLSRTVDLGVDDSRIEIVSFGNEKAAGTDEGAASAPPSWAHDRRAELVYVRGGER
jgi:outer membrane protein OmpA-like peptidoglycan-associated protein